MSAFVDTAIGMIARTVRLLALIVAVGMIADDIGNGPFPSGLIMPWSHWVAAVIIYLVIEFAIWERATGKRS